jgi:hypothetical protein
MKIITRGVLDWDGKVLEEEAYEYTGPVTQAKSGGSSPQPIDPYQQAAAQYGLSTGTANYNARLNRTGNTNALGSSGWGITGYDNGGGVQQGPQGSNSGAYPTGGWQPTPGGGMRQIIPGGSGGQMTAGQGMPAPSGNPGAGFGLGGTGGLTNPGSGGGLGGVGGTVGAGGGGSFSPTPGFAPGSFNIPGTNGSGSGAPIYGQNTTLNEPFQSALQKPIDTSGIAGMPGGPSTTQDLSNTRNALFNQQMAYLQPQEALAREQQQSQLANQGVMPGSEAYTNAIQETNRGQTFANQQAADSAIIGGGQEQSRLFGMGQGALNSQIQARDAPINEFNQLSPGGAGQAQAMTPDISGAFQQQYQGQLNAANQSNAANNANIGAGTSLLGSYLMYLALL